MMMSLRAIIVLFSIVSSAAESWRTLRSDTKLDVPSPHGSCRKMSECVPCSEQEKGLAYCLSTGKREHFLCETAEGSRSVYELCDGSVRGGSMTFWKFQSAMAICLALSLFVIHKRQHRIQSLHDTRLARMNT